MRNGQTTSSGRLFADRSAGWVVRGGGFAIIASILGILVFIALETLPLLKTADLKAGEQRSMASVPVEALVVDEYGTHVLAAHADGTLRVTQLSDGSQGEVAAVVEPGAAHRAHALPRREAFVFEDRAGRLRRVPYEFAVRFEGVGEDLQRFVEARLQPEDEAFPLRTDSSDASRVSAVNQDEDGVWACLAQLPSGELAWLWVSQSEDFLGNVESEVQRQTLPADDPYSALVVDANLGNAYGVTESGQLVWWAVERGELVERERVPLPGRQVQPTTLDLLLGEQALVVGTRSGEVSVWFSARDAGDQLRMVQAKVLPAQAGPVLHVAVSMRDRSFLIVDGAGRMSLDYSTSASRLFEGSCPLEDVEAIAYSPKGQAAYLAGGGRLVEVQIDNPHPEITLSTLFGKVWYEGYSEPSYVWQSGGGTEEEESKMSLVPLLWGTLKGTIYALIIAIPLGVLGALYTSQFLHPRLRRIVKPTVEVMASLPSVVLGFLAGLWLAPRLEVYFPGVLLFVLLLPLAMVLAGWTWSRVPKQRRARLGPGAELFAFMLAGALALALALGLNEAFERIAFAADYRNWLMQTLGLNYDQRNAVVVGIAMGFAIIPIIFSISEDAISNVPRHLISGSLALGASRWETVVRVVLPTASPGIFSATMIGFGRAIGETMIVFMGSGNTPVMDGNPFNGLRTLSANIAVEITEAPVHGSLYRTLFLSALLLFALTFVFNTAADVVSQRLRRRYANL